MKDFERITSRDNRRLVNARKIRDGKIAGMIFIEGKRLAEEAIRSQIEVVECLLSDGFSDVEIMDAIRSQNAFIATVPEKIFHSIADTDSPQGIVLIGKRPALSPKFEIHSSSLPIALYLSEINNPSNLGAVLRTAEAAGVRDVMISKNSVDPFSPKALRASMGSAFRLNITTGLEFEDVARLASRHNLVTTGADTKAKANYIDVDWKKPRLLIVGSESRGLTDEQKENLDELVCIPMANDVESLNLAVSAAVILFEARRQTG